MSDVQAFQSDVQAFRSDDMPASADVSARRTARNVAVEVADAARLADVRADWTDLLTRADALNVFMDPALLRAAAEAEPAVEHRALLAWKSTDGRRQLVGIWSFAVGHARRSVLPIRVLSGPAYTHCYLATPVIDRDCLDDTLDAMLDAIANDRQLPKIVALDMLEADGPTCQALLRVLERRGSAPCVFERSRRPKLASELDGKAYLEKALSGSTRKKLRQHRRRLSEKGSLTSVIVSDAAAVRGALEEFLALEASGWKGQQGTALLSNKADAAFMRSAVGALADLGRASIHSLYLDGKPVSMQIVARSGAAAFTWKTTYNEAFQEFSPGTLLLEDYTAAFLADRSIACVDSCSFDDTGFMAAWSERIAIVNLWIDARHGGSLAFHMLSRLQKVHAALRATAKSAYLAWQKSRKR
jgi:CelD/BcsL family acetyltransferase involved in cellulose biosynthesis